MKNASRAAELHRRAIVIDGHTDILMPIADGRMRLKDRVEIPDPAGWEPPAAWAPSAEATFYRFSPHTAFFQTMGQYDLSRFRAGGVTAEVMAVFIEAANLDRPLHRALEMVAWLNREYAENTDFVPVTTAADIRRAKASGHVGGILGFEGFEPLGADLKLLEVFVSLGLRLATLTHSRRNAYADGTQPGIHTAGLSELGRSAVRGLNDLGVVIDLAHLAAKGCADVLALSEHPVVLSHTSPPWLFRSDPDGDGTDRAARRVIEGIAAGGGVVGIIGYGQESLSGMVEEIQTLIRWVGADHVGLGTDFFGLESAPPGLKGIQDLPNLTAAMVEAGLSDDAILGILGGNYLRVFEQVWGG